MTGTDFFSFYSLIAKYLHMSIFIVLPSGVNTFFPKFWKHPDALFKMACGWRRIHCRTVWMTASRPLKFTTDSNNSMGKSVSHGPVCLSGVSASERAESVWRESLSRTGVFEWCECFREDRECVERVSVTDRCV
jgi:hypothetical protein